LLPGTSAGVRSCSMCKVKFELEFLLARAPANCSSYTRQKPAWQRSSTGERFSFAFYTLSRATIKGSRFAACFRGITRLALLPFDSSMIQTCTYLCSNKLVSAKKAISYFKKLPIDSASLCGQKVTSKPSEFWTPRSARQAHSSHFASR